jgi:hypothetical protein
VERAGKILGQLGQSQTGSAPSQRSRFDTHQGRGSSYRSDGSSALAARPAGSEVGSEGSPHSESKEHNGFDNRSYTPRRRRPGVATDLTKVRGILSKVLSHRGLDKKVERYEFILHWHEIVGERLAEVSKPECIVNKQLIVNVLHPAWAQELTMIKPVLLESLAKFLRPGDVVRDMIFRVRTFAP